MRPLSYILLVALVSNLTNTPLWGKDLTEKLDQIAARAQVSKKIASLSVAVQVGDQVILTKGYGEADLEHHTPANVETVYRIGSLTKMFTAAAILQLADAGALNLQDYVSTHVPIFEDAPEEITLHQLLTHTSGLLNYTRVMGERNRLPLTPEEVLILFEEQDLNFDPGEDWEYSNSGYFLLGLTIEEASGKSYGEYIEEELAGPLDLESTVYCDNTRLIENRARGYVVRSGNFQNTRQIEMNGAFAAGALCSNVLDLTKWARALFGGKVLSPEHLKQMTFPVEVAGRSLEYGYGLYIDESLKQRRFQHGGSISGFSAYIAHYPETDLTVVVLANTGGVDTSGIGEELAAVVLKSLPLKSPQKSP